MLQHHVRSLFVGLLAGSVVGLMPAPVAADTSWVTLADLVNGALGRGSYTSVQLDELDLNGDGQRNVFDIVCFLGGCLPVVKFESSALSVREGDGVISVPVPFGGSVTGTLNYQILAASTADSGTDYFDLGGGALPVSGTSANIPLNILDDILINEEIELVLIELLPGTGYNLGAFTSMTVSIIDNDSTWRGVVEDGGAMLGFTLEILDVGGTLTGTVVSGGDGTLPPGAWSATVTKTADTFEAVVDPIAVAESVLSFQAVLSRTLSFSADATTNPANHTVNDTLIQGDYSETISSAADPYLASDIAGTFSLVRQLPTPSSFDPVPEPAP